jgi:hypothetical protein
VKFEVKLKDCFHILEADPTCSIRSVAGDMEICNKTLKIIECKEIEDEFKCNKSLTIAKKRKT